MTADRDSSRSKWARCRAALLSVSGAVALTFSCGGEAESPADASDPLAREMAGPSAEPSAPADTNGEAPEEGAGGLDGQAPASGDSTSGATAAPPSPESSDPGDGSGPVVDPPSPEGVNDDPAPPQEPAVMVETPPLATEAELAALEEAGFALLDDAPADCSAVVPAPAAFADAEDFSAARSGAATDHALVMDLGSVVRRVDTYLTTNASDGHQHRITFPNEALVALLEGKSVLVRTTEPLGTDDGHDHLVRVHSCGMYQP